ncbi:MAG: alpha/beta hydrolase [Anaerolineae bacterium]
MLLIHGWASSGQMWSRLSRDLQADARFWAVDLYGFGQSPRPQGDEPIHIEHHAERLLDFCEQHQLQPKLIIGHSMGGMLALKLATLRADLTERLVLMSPVVTGRYGFMVDLNKLFTGEWANFALAKSKPFWLLSQNILMPLLGGPTHWYLDQEATARIVQDYQRASWQASAYALASIARQNLEPHLPHIQHPALVIVGSNDTTVPPDEGRLAAHRLPNAQLLELPGIHHQPLDESPQQVVGAVREFLQ